MSEAGGLPAGTWLADPARSVVGFSVAHAAGPTVRGRFARFAARLDVGRDDASLAGIAWADSLAITDEGVAALVHRDDVLGRARHPRLRFASTELRRRGELLDVDGLLTVRGRTLAVTGVGTVSGPHGARRTGARALRLGVECVLDRRQFGVDWTAPLPDGTPAGTEVAIAVTLVLVEA